MTPLKLCPWALAFLLAAVLSQSTHADDWHYGRSTPWYWDIHHGSCGKGYLWPDQGTGWDIAALSDKFPAYGGSCGRCYEVKCDGRTVNDGYGQSVNRNGVCKDSEASVIVTITDTCPCYFAANAYSNKRWCCGDMPHMDLSVWAFEKLADMKWGVIPIKYRQVSCGQQPSKRAYGGGFPGIFPPKSIANSKNLDWDKYFPNGGYTNPMDGSSYVISTSDFKSRIGQGGSSYTPKPTGWFGQFGKK